MEELTLGVGRMMTERKESRGSRFKRASQEATRSFFRVSSLHFLEILSKGPERRSLCTRGLTTMCSEGLLEKRKRQLERRTSGLRPTEPKVSKRAQQFLQSGTHRESE